MKKTIRVRYERTIQVRQFEPQVVDLMVEEERDVPLGRTAVQEIRELYKQLEAIGDALLADALAKPDLHTSAKGRS